MSEMNGREVPPVHRPEPPLRPLDPTLTARQGSRWTEVTSRCAAAVIRALVRAVNGWLEAGWLSYRGPFHGPFR